MVVRNLASQVTSRNHNFVDTTVISSSHMSTRDDVNANKSLYGNEHETPSTRSPGFQRPWGCRIYGGPRPGCLRTAGNSAGRCTSWVIMVTEGMLEHSDLAGSGTNVPSHAAKVPSASHTAAPGTRHASQRLTVDGGWDGAGTRDNIGRRSEASMRGAEVYQSGRMCGRGGKYLTRWRL